MKTIDGIKSKIKALMAKTTENGATPQEMESALRKANQLMTEYFITVHDIQDHDTIDRCMVKRFELVKTGYRMDYFYNSLAELFDCVVYYNNTHISFFGHEQDTDICGYFYSMISRTCLAERDKFLESDNGKYLLQYLHGRSVSRDFIVGFLLEVSERLDQMYAEKESHIQQSYALMVVNKKEKVQNEFADLNLNIKYRKQGRLRCEAEAYNAGIQTGREIPLTQGIDTSAHVFQLGN